MTMDPEQGGTLPLDEGDFSRTPEGEDANAEVAALREQVAKLEAMHQQSLAEKGTLEAAKRELADLRARQASPAQPYGGQGVDPAQAEMYRLQQRLNELRSSDSLDGRLVTTMFDYQGQLQSQINELKDLLAVPYNEHAEIQRIQSEAAQRGERISAATAKRLAEADRLSAQASTLNQKDAELREAEDSRRRGVVRTSTVGVPASEAEGRTMTMEQYGDWFARLSPAQQVEANAKTSITSDGRMSIRR